MPQSAGLIRKQGGKWYARRYARATLPFVPLDKLDDAWIDMQVAVDAMTVIGAFNDYFVKT